MNALINIIHPYTYKLVGKELIIGRVDEYKERDQMLAEFLKQSLDNNARIIHHRHQKQESFGGVLCDTAFMQDPVYPFLFDSRIEQIVTTHYGVPLPDKKPAALSDENWGILTGEYLSHSELKRKVGTPNLVLFIGGVFENCISNAISYFLRDLKQTSTSIHYIDGLCVSLDQEQKEKTASRLAEQGVKPISSNKAIKLLTS